MHFLNIFQYAKLSIIESIAQELMLTNEVSQDFGLSLSPQEARGIVTARESTLKDYDRVELDTEILNKLILSLCTSPYLQQSEYVDTINELHELFHYIKNELDDHIGDDELIEKLSFLFTHVCHGDLELLKGRETERIIRQYHFGNEPDEDPEAENDDENQDDWEG